MADIVLGMASSHGPMLSSPPEKWGARVPADKANKELHFRGRVWSYDELVAERAHENLGPQITLDTWRKRHARCRAAVEDLARVYHDARIDVAVIVGNDHYEMFRPDTTPALAVFWGDTILNNDFEEDEYANMGPGVALAIHGHTRPGGAEYRGHSDLGRHIIQQTTRDDFDVSAVKRMSYGHTPHAYGFIYRQIMKDKVVPNVPIVLNTLYPPNQPTVRRCSDFGVSIVRAIRSWESDARVALFASGGLTHFVIDEEVDEILLDAMRRQDVSRMAMLDEAIFQSGTSEVKNWVPVVGAMADLGYEARIVDYVPCYRSEAGTGNAMGFVYWQA